MQFLTLFEILQKQNIRYLLCRGLAVSIYVVLLFNSSFAQEISDSCYVKVDTQKIAKPKFQLRGQNYNSIYGSKKGRYFSNFRSIKSEIDSYTILSPIVRICKENNDKFVRDTSNENLIKNYWKNRYKNILSYYKYRIIDYDFLNPNVCDIISLIVELSLLKPSIKEYITPNFLNSLINNPPTRYSIFTFIRGAYREYDGVSKIFMGVPGKKFGSFEAHLIVIDNKEGKIVFIDGQYDELIADKTESTNYVLVSLLKNLHYKN